MILINQNIADNITTSRTRRVAVFILFLIVLLMLSSQMAKSMVLLKQDSGKYLLALHSEIFEDKKGTLSIEEVNSKMFIFQFTQNKKRIPGFGITDSAIWSKFQLKNDIGKTSEWLLELANSRMQEIDIFIFDSLNQLVQHKTKRLDSPFYDREIQHRNNIFRLYLEPYQKITVYIRTQSQTSHFLPWTLWSTSSFIKHQT
jgi:two-component system, sensor histidine kinase LadS